jgi:anti-sigma regulatory factor (Ser/Thr protein kinase)
VGVLWLRDLPVSAATVRRSLGADLQRAGMSADLAADAAVLASELVANAVRHARALPSGHFKVAWHVTDADVTIAVTDGGSDATPQIRAPAPTDTSGRGLAIVAALADDWGVEHTDGSNTVWARLALRDGTSA